MTTILKQAVTKQVKRAANSRPSRRSGESLEDLLPAKYVPVAECCAAAGTSYQDDPNSHWSDPEFWAAALPDRKALRVVHRRWSAAALAIVIEELSKLRDSALRREAKQHRETRQRDAG